MLGARQRRATNQHQLLINFAIKMKRSASYQGDLKAFTKKIASLQKSKNSLGFVIYEDENVNPSKATVVRGTNGIDANLDFLNLVHSEQPKMAFTKKQVEKILDLTAKINKLKFKTTAERKDWKETITKRWRNICRVVSSAEAKKKKPKWTSILPWNKAEPEQDAEAGAATYETDQGEGEEDQSGDEQQEEDAEEQEEEEEEEEEEEQDEKDERMESEEDLSEDGKAFTDLFGKGANDPPSDGDQTHIKAEQSPDSKPLATIKKEIAKAI
jgi:hypothetical protein